MSAHLSLWGALQTLDGPRRGRMRSRRGPRSTSRRGPRLELPRRGAVLESLTHGRLNKLRHVIDEGSVRAFSLLELAQPLLPLSSHGGAAHVRMHSTHKRGP